jgi:hypothetical protein
LHTVAHNRILAVTVDERLEASGRMTMEDSRIANAFAIPGFLVSCAATSWLLLFSVEPPPASLARVCFLCVVACCLAVVVWCWSVIVANIAKKVGWEQKTCDWLTVLFFGSALLLQFFGSTSRVRGAGVVFFCVFPACRLIRRLAFPGAKSSRVLHQELVESPFPKISSKS